MNLAGNTYWLSNRRMDSVAVAETVPALSWPSRSRMLMPNAIGYLGLVPSWVLLAMIMVATLAICSTVILRTRNELAGSAAHFQLVQSEVDVMRRSNASLKGEIVRLTSDPAAIESSARARLGMVRPNDIVVAVGTSQLTSQSETVALFR